jgi:resuscitation-promoting factor RpfA
MTNNELGRVLFEAGMALGAASGVYVAAAVAVRVWTRRAVPARRWAGAPLLTLVGSGLAFASPAPAQLRSTSPPRSPSTSITEAHHSQGASSERHSPDTSPAGSQSPPAPPWSEPGGFPPPRPAGRTGEASASRHDAPDEHTSGSEPAKSVGRVVVKPGDSLWSIAAEVLGTSDPARIARYWPRIHRTNRELIGADPNLIFPGQVLELPDETRRK